MLISSKTDLGKVRQTNQDYFIIKNEKIGIFKNIFMVADGVGSNMKSGYASKHTCEFILQSLKNTKDKINLTQELARIIQLANTDLYYRIIANSDYNGMGTTLVMATVNNNKILVANVGDSRCYLIRDNIVQITKDHSMAEELVRENIIERYSDKYYEYKPQLTRAVGANKKINPDFFEAEIKSGDYILLCTDGLTNMLNDKEIFNIVMSEDLTVDERVDTLVNSANEKGGKDNIAVVLIYIDYIEKYDEETEENTMSVFEEEKNKQNKKVIDDLILNNNPMNQLKVNPDEILKKDDTKIYDGMLGRSRRRKEKIEDTIFRTEDLKKNNGQEEE